MSQILINELNARIEQLDGVRYGRRADADALVAQAQVANDDADAAEALATEYRAAVALLDT